MYIGSEQWAELGFEYMGFENLQGEWEVAVIGRDGQDEQGEENGGWTRTEAQAAVDRMVDDQLEEARAGPWRETRRSRSANRATSNERTTGGDGISCRDVGGSSSVGGDDTDSVSGNEDGSDTDSVGSCRSTSAPTISYSSILNHGNIFSILGEVRPTLPEQAEEDEVNSRDTDFQGSSGDSRPEREKGPPPAAGIRPPLLALSRRQSRPRAAHRVGAEADSKLEEARDDPIMQEIWQHATNNTTRKGGFHVGTASKGTLAMYERAARLVDAEAGQLGRDTQGDECGLHHRAPSSTGSNYQPQATRPQATGSSYDSSTAQGEGKRPSFPLPDRGATTRLLEVQDFIGGLRSLQHGRLPDAADRRASHSLRRPTVSPCEADGLWAGEITDSEKVEIQGRSRVRLRRDRASRTPRSPSPPAPLGKTAATSPPRQFYIPQEYLYCEGQEATGIGTRPGKLSKLPVALDREEALREHSFRQAGTRISTHARRCLEEIYRGVSAVLGTADTTVDLGGGRRAPRNTTLRLEVNVAGAGAMALVDTGAEVTCISSAFLHRFWDVLGPYYTEECLLRLKAADGDAVLVEDGGDELQQEGRGLEDAGELLAPPTFVPQWEGKKRLWDFLAARSAAQRRQGGTGRTISMISLAGRPTEMGISNAVDEVYVGAISRGASRMEERAETHVNAAVDRDTPVGMARADDDGWSFSVDVLLEQKADPELASLRAFIESKGRTVPEEMTEKEEAAFRLAAKAYYIRPSDEVLCRLWRSSRSAARITVFHQVVVPTRLREVVLEAYHDHALGGHTGLGRLYERILRKYYWPSLLVDATTHVKGCDLCNTRKNPPRRAVSEWAHRQLAWKPFQRISMDFTPMGITSKSGNNSLLVAVDHLTRFVEAWPCSVETADVVVKALTALTTRYGAPQEIISDNGSTLVAKTVKDLAKGLGAKKSTTAPYRHEANGLVERSIQSFQTMLKLAVEDGHEDEWDEHIDVARFAFNANYHTSVGECPFFLLYGTDPNVPLDLILKADQPQYADLKDYTSRLAARLRKAWAAAREQNEATRQERYRRHKASAPYGFTKFETNARVYVFSPIKAKALSRKLTPAWSGPYRVLGQEIPGVYLVQPADGRTGQSIKVHVSRLKPYVTWAANYVARTRLHRDAFLDDPATELETPPPPPRGAQERQVRRREPTEAELLLEGKFLADPKDSTSTWKVDKVTWDERSGEVVAFAVKVHVLRSGGYRLLHKKTEPMEVLAVDEAREWVAASSLLNKGLTPERAI